MVDQKDIFELSGVNTVLKIGGEEYPFADPILKQKILLQKELKALQAKKESMTDEDFVLAYDEWINNAIIMYIPTLPREVVSNLGDDSKTHLFDKVMNLKQIILDGKKPEDITPMGKA